MQQWSKRPVALALLLLLAVGSTWYLTRASLDMQNGGPSVATNQDSPNVPTPEVTPSEQSAKPGGKGEPDQGATVEPHGRDSRLP